MVNNPLIRPYFLWGWHWGGALGLAYHVSLLVPYTLSLVGPIPTPSPQHSLRIFQKQPKNSTPQKTC